VLVVNEMAVLRPAHLALFPNSGQAINRLFQQEQRIEQRLLARENARQEAAHRLGQHEQHAEKQSDLEPAVGAHGQNFSGHKSAATKYANNPMQIRIKSTCPIMWEPSLFQALAASHVDQRQREEEDGANQGDNIGHRAPNRIHLTKNVSPAG